MKDNLLANSIIIAILLDGFLYLLYRARQVHKLKILTSALTDKLYYSTLITIGINILVYLGYAFGINTFAFNLLSYLGPMGLFVIAIVLGLMKDEVKKNYTVYSKS